MYLGLWTVFVVVKVLLFTGEVDPLPTFQDEPSEPDLSVVEGRDLTLNWTFDMDGAFRRVSFGKGSVVILEKDKDGLFVQPEFKNRTRVEVTTDSETSITILAVQREDEGQYQFEILNTNRQRATSNIEIQVHYEPNITFVLGNQTLNESDTLILTCEADGNPKPVITWSRVSDNISVSKNHTINGKQDEGGYRCTAMNGVGSPDMRIVYVFVQNFRPINTIVTTNLTANNVVLVNETFLITCSAEANPKAKYQFYNGQENFKNDTSSVAVVITSVTEIVRQVTYSCTPFNYYGNGPTGVINVTVQYSPKGTILTSSPANTTSLRGTSLWLNCITNANPSAHTYYIYFNGDPIGNRSSGVFNVTVEEDGVYTCAPLNKAGTGDNATINITVVEPPSATIQESKVTVLKNSSITLNCSVFGKPDPTITWTTVGSTEVLSYSPLLHLDSVKIPGTENYTIRYQCTAGNGVGTPATDIVSVVVHFTPDIDHAPAAYQVVEGSGTILFCNATGNPKPNITWSKQGNSSTLSTTETLKLAKLTKEDDGSVYTCTATNSAGLSQATSIITVFSAPEYSIHVCPSQVTEGENVQLYCNGTGNPQPEVAWKRSGKVLKRANAHIITSINRSEAGIFQCVAWNGIGKNFTENCSVSVQYRPTLTNVTTTNTTIVRDTVMFLNCSTDANPSADKYFFYFNGDLIGNSSVGLFSVTVKEDGIFTCVPVNEVGTGDNATVNVQTVVASLAVVIPHHDKVIEGGNVTLICNVSGVPYPSVVWTQIGNKTVLSQKTSLAVVNVRRPGTTDNTIQYQCTASNGVGTPATASTMITVYYAPEGTKLTTIPRNTTMIRDSLLTLKCEADASPEAEFTIYFNGILNKTNSLGIFQVTVITDGVYTCIPINRVGPGKSVSINVTTVDPPVAIVSPKIESVVEGRNLNLTCDVSGKPKPSIKWTRVGRSLVLSNDSLLTIMNVSGPGTQNNTISYQCSASNGVGKTAEGIAIITVEVPAFISNLGNDTINARLGENVSFFCRGDGHPKPEFTWTKDGVRLNLKSEDDPNSLMFQVKESSPGLYRCKVENELNKAFKWFHLNVGATSLTVTCTVTNRVCDDKLQETLRNFISTVKEKVKSEISTLKDVRPLNHRCGSVTVYMLLEFTQNEDIGEVVSVLKSAAAPGGSGFGEFSVDVSSIQAVSSDELPSTRAPTAKEEETADSWIKVAGATGGACVFCGVVGACAWWVYKKRKCRKETRGAVTPSDAIPLSSNHSTLSDGKPCDYAMSGPQPPVDTVTGQQLGAVGGEAVPTYAVVDKPRKKEKKKNKGAAEQKPVDDQYAVMEKSKRKKNKEEDNTYAEVDMSKKSKKKPKPGEVLYADLGEFHQMKKMPEVSTSPKALPPIKRLENYAETQYADITQFLKGNPEDPGAELRIDSTTQAVSNTATGSKEESSAGNTGDGAEAANETGL